MIRDPQLRAAVLLLFVVASVAYLVWRVVFTLNPEAPVYSWVFLGLETYALLSALAFYSITLRRADPTPRPAPAGARVDVFICTYNEEVALLRQTIRRALAMDYPHRTFVLDDGRRPEVRALAEELGCVYVTREKNTHYKAGNLNHALLHSDGELVVVLDADHLLARDFLTRLLGYFSDPEVALVQIPQVFYNLDSFQHHFRARRWRLWHEGAIFHHAMQPGANRWNAAFFVGTGAIVRRQAIEEIGGFATGSTTEDAFTCLRLHAAGWRSVYHDEPLGYLIAPESLQQYLTQRLRWGQGSMQILRLENPLFRRGLSLKQRLVYTAALSSFAHAVVHLAYYLAPALYLLGGPAPLRVAEPIHFLPLVAHIALDVAIFKLWLGPLARPLLTECYKFLNFYVFLRALGGYFKKAGQLKFRVTPKGRDAAAPVRILAPQAVLLLLNGMAFGIGSLRLASGQLDTLGALGTAVAMFFSGLFVLIGTMTFLFAHERLAAHAEFTFPDEIDAWLNPARDKAVVLRANAAELRVLVRESHAYRPGDRLTLALHLDGRAEPARVSGRVREVSEVLDGVVLRVSADALETEVRDRLFDRFVEHAVPRMLDPMVMGWSGQPASRETGRYFLPMQENVL
jgi:cellulose synthase (UDP-forming)